MNTLAVGQILDVPRHIARCPECDAKLNCQLSTPDLSDLCVDCEFDESLEGEADEVLRHRYNQGDWQPVIEAVEEWLKGQYQFEEVE